MFGDHPPGTRQYPFRQVDSGAETRTLNAVMLYDAVFLGGVFAIDAIRLKHIAQRHHTLQFVNVGPLDDRYEIKMVLAHPFESQI